MKCTQQAPALVWHRRWFNRVRWFAAAAVFSLAVWVAWGDWPNPVADPLPAKADGVVVLGGGHEERPRQAMKLYEEGRAPWILVTGDGGIIVSDLTKRGLPPPALRHETEAKSTWENAQFSRPLLEAEGARSVILVTTWFHAQRAKRIFEEQYPNFAVSVSFEPRPLVLTQWDAACQRRERLAALHHLFVHGLWCF